ncbi:beta-lactamase family protein [Candidatus Aminicenantes bacterium AC-708-M15]|jgi:CubicO group peptidase (beta-lactamase class C family)|nr:beta-lactamase family protein [SCandidatus Aminicenantes bacterium Aminicenantia_JdfR_composite]MCP2597453.1 beta-lactamase family protein [Candidatus Aminicenantes bacterium AC-335-G13]MCP2604420.1 beta-lactamase family protein [Candidatus Aminicenantes bacterium AC-708-M15]MCP2606282.1 beta-lactamase family protein [Candidatus Aminicenantes bacterium AC-708-I09]MCP2619214.1 beta-lactamase family protein [Candidatus Aminicenantes bacterium AC-335-K20]MCP2620863.1 beta-lactamase family prot
MIYSKPNFRYFTFHILHFTILIFTIHILVFNTYADSKIDKIDRLFSPWNKSNSPGCALAIIKDGKIVYKKGYGMANLELNVPITPKTVFYIGSCSKQFVAFSIALLAKRKILSLDDDIRKYIPELPNYGKPITIKHLIYHTSGLRDFFTLEDIAGIPFGFYHKNDVLSLIASQKKLNFEPGEEYLYSNSGYFLLALIVERVSKMSFREFAEKNIFKPLGMKNSCFQDDYTRIIKNRASGYFPGKKGEFRNFISTFDCVGSGGLYTSVEDLYLWDQNFYHCKVGGKELIKQIQTPGVLNNGERINYAFGLVIGSYRGLKTVSHGGALGGYRAGIIRFPEQKFTVIILSNLSSFNPMKMCKKIADIYLAGEFKEEKKKEYLKISRKRLKEKAGFYMNSKTLDLLNIKFRKGKLVANIYGGEYTLGLIKEETFEVIDAPSKTIIKFKKDPKTNKLFIRVLREGYGSSNFEKIELVKFSSLEIEEYVGNYLSEELDIVFKILKRDKKLCLVAPRKPEIFLQPIIKDYFKAGRFKIRFIRDKEGRISGFLLNAGRVRNLEFKKLY